MPLRVRHHVVLLAVSAVVFFVNLDQAQLWDEDEPKNAECAREMFERGDWITPTFNYALRYDKPVLVYWLMILAYKTFGVNEFAARFWSAVLAMGTTLATYQTGRTLLGPRIGFWGGWMMATNLLFVVAGRAATPDSALIFCTTLAMLAFVQSTWGAGPTLAGADALRDYLPKTWRGFASIYAAMALGALAKGPVAVVLPVMGLGCYLLFVRARIIAPAPPGKRSWLLRFFSPVGWLQIAWNMRPFTTIAVMAIITLPWYLTVGWATDGDWLLGFFGRHNLGRFLSPMEGHRGPIVYYVPAILFGFFPWSILLPAAVWQLRRRLASDRAWAAYLFLSCWAGLWIGFFSLSGTKLPSYVLPAYPAFALMVAAWLDDWVTHPRAVSVWLPRIAFATLVVAGVGTTVGVAVFARRALPGDEWVALVGAPLMAGGACGCMWVARQPRRAVAALAAASLAFVVLTFDFAAAAVSRHQNSASLVSIARRSLASPPKLATFDYSLPSLVYYAQDRVEQFYRPDELARFLTESPEGMAVCTQSDFDALKPSLPEAVTVIARQRRFLRNGEVLLLGRPREMTRR